MISGLLALARGVGNSTVVEYVDEVENSTNPIQVREFLARHLLSRSTKLSASHSQSVLLSMLNLARSNSTPSELRVFLLKNLGSHPSLLDAKPLIPLLVSTDSRIKAAACQGIARTVRANRSQGNHQGNKAVFDSVKAVSGEALDLDEVRVMATFSEDYGRDYLLAKCAGSPEKIAAIFRSDDALVHPGLLREAVTLSQAESHRQKMKTAIRYGTKDPNDVALRFMAGPDSDIETGLKLLAFYPEHVRSHDSSIRQLAESPVMGIRNAAQTLLPLLVN